MPKYWEMIFLSGTALELNNGFTTWYKNTLQSRTNSQDVRMKTQMTVLCYIEAPNLTVKDGPIWSLPLTQKHSGYCWPIMNIDMNHDVLLLLTFLFRFWSTESIRRGTMHPLHPRYLVRPIIKETARLHGPLRFCFPFRANLSSRTRWLTTSISSPRLSLAPFVGSEANNANSVTAISTAALFFLPSKYFSPERMNPIVSLPFASKSYDMSSHRPEIKQPRATTRIHTTNGIGAVWKGLKYTRFLPGMMVGAPDWIHRVASFSVGYAPRIDALSVRKRGAVIDSYMVEWRKGGAMIDSFMVEWFIG